MGANENAMTRRFDKLAVQWEAFCGKSAPLLRWLLLPDEPSVVSAFIDLESTEGAYTEDGWIPLYSSFAAEFGHGYSLAEELAKLGQAIGGVDDEPSWDCPVAQPDEDDCGYLRRCLLSLHTRLAEGLDHLAIVLMPPRIANTKAYQRWLFRLLSQPWPGEIRFIVLDNAQAPVYDLLVLQASVEKVHSVHASLDMPGALADLSAPPEKPAPGDLYREQFVALQNAMGQNQAEKASNHADQALGIAAEQGWPHLEVPVHMILAALRLSSKDSPGAIQCYKAAQASARQARQAQIAGSAKMQMVAILGECSVLVQGKQYGAAAPLYEEAAIIAESEKDAASALEARRMACFCHAKDSEWPQARENGLACLSHAEGLGAEKTKQSAFAYAVKDLLKASRKAGPAEEERQCRERVEALLGEDWEAKMKEGQGA